MRKILLSFEGTDYSEGAFDFARRMNEGEPVLLTGVFLPQVDVANSWSYAYGGGSVYIPLIERVDAETVEENISRFKAACARYGIDHRVHTNFSSYALPELQKETRFADLMILGGQLFYENLGTESPNEYLRDVLHEAECPVVVTPEKFNYPESIVLAYDGSSASVRAIKNFAYLFPELCELPATVAFASDKSGKKLPDEDYIRELVARHFSDLTFRELQFAPKDYFSTWMADQANPILVTGAFGRSGFSQIFRHSFASDMITDHLFPVFISHG